MRLWIAAVVALALGALAGDAEAATLKLLATYHADGGVVADGERYAMFPARHGRLEVYDTHTRRSFTVPSAGCAPMDAAAARFLLGCPRPTGSLEYQLLEVHGRVRSVVDVRPSDTLDSIGRYWLRGTTTHPDQDPSSDAYGSSLFVNLLSGERREAPRVNGWDAVRDLDSIDLHDPALRPPGPSGDAFYYYDAPFVLSRRDARLVLRRGESRTLLTADCSADCRYTFHLAEGRATWLRTVSSSSVDVMGYVAGSGRRVAGRISHVPATYDLRYTLTHTRDAILLQIPRTTGEVEADGGALVLPTSYKLYAVPWRASPDAVPSAGRRGSHPARVNP